MMTTVFTKDDLSCTSHFAYNNFNLKQISKASASWQEPRRSAATRTPLLGNTERSLWPSS